MSRKRILFVDDETLVLQGLQRMLRSMRGEWDMEFVDSGSKAIQRMNEESFDAIVSDMLMPGMNGVELLARVKEQSPKTARMILSGHAEQQLAMRSAGVAHRYLAKPCEADAVKSTVTRVVSPGFSVRNERLMALISKTDLLPSIPALYIEINKLLQHGEAPITAIGEVVARDIGMTANILKLVNSAFFGLSRRLSDPAEAVAYLGVDLLKSLVLTLHVFTQFEPATAKGCSLDRLWRHSLRVAALARLVARTEQAPPGVVNEAVAAGMLHDAGKLILASHFAEQSDGVRELVGSRGMDPVEAEREAFGSSHAEVGGYLLGLWGLPASLVDSVTLHHTPEATDAPGFDSLTAVHAADYLAHKLSPAPDGFPLPKLGVDYLQQLGLSDRLPIWEEAARSQSPSEAD